MAETQVTTREQFQGLIRESIAEIARDNPQVILDAMAQNPEAMRASLEKSGIIISGPANPRPQDVVDSHKTAQEEGRIVRGFGARLRAALPSATFKDQDGNTRRTFLWGEQLGQAEAWFRAFFNHGGLYTDPVTKKPLAQITGEMNKNIRAPSFPFTAEPGTGGGFLVPMTVAAEVFEVMQERFVLRDYVEVFTSAAPLRIPRRTNLIAVSRGGASTNITQVDPASILGATTLSPERVSAMAYIDPLLALAAAVGPVRWVIGQFAEAMAKDYQRVIAAGDPTLREPRGILNLPTSGTNTFDQAKTATWTDTDVASRRNSIRQAYYSISQPHRESDKFVWIGNNDVLQVLASLNDLNQQPFRDQTLGAPYASYLGKRFIETLALTTAGSGPFTSTLLGGDMSQYAWVESPDGLRIEQTTVGGEAWTSDTIGVKMVQWFDGAPITPPTFVNLPSVVVL